MLFIIHTQILRLEEELSMKGSMTVTSLVIHTGGTWEKWNNDNNMSEMGEKYSFSQQGREEHRIMTPLHGKMNGRYR